MFEIYSIGDSAFLAEILNGIAMIAGTGDLRAAVLVGFGLGVLILSFQAVLQNRGPSWQTLAVSMVLYMVMFGPGVRVSIENAYTGQVRTVDNVPFGVAAAGSMLSQIGYTLTNLFETSFSEPEFTTQGFLSSHKRLRAARKMLHNGFGNPDDPLGIMTDKLRRSWQNYITECATVEIDLIDQGFLEGSTTRLDHGRLPDTLRVDLGSRYYTEIYVNGSPETLQCEPAYDILVNYMRSTWLPQLKPAMVCAIPGSYCENGNPTGGISTDFLLQQAIDGMDACAVGACEVDDILMAYFIAPIIIDGVIARYIMDGSNVYATMLADARRQRNIDLYARKSLFETSVQPMLTFFEGLFYALTPIMAFAIGLGMFGIRLIGKYVAFAFWIQLWMPLFAISNKYLHMAAARELDSIPPGTADVLSIIGIYGWDSLIQDYLAVGGLMASSVPLIAMFLVSGSYFAMTRLSEASGGKDYIDEKAMAPSTFNASPTYVNEPIRGTHFERAPEALMKFGVSRDDALHTASTRREAEVKQQAFESSLSQTIGQSWNQMDSATIAQRFSQSAAAGYTESEKFLQAKTSSLAEKWENKEGISRGQLQSLVASGALAYSTGKGGAQVRAGLEKQIQEQLGLGATQARSLASDISARLTEDKGALADFRENFQREIAEGKDNVFTRGLSEDQKTGLSEKASEALKAEKIYQEAVSTGIGHGARMELDGVQVARSIAGNEEAFRTMENAMIQWGMIGAVERFMASRPGQDALAMLGGDQRAAKAYAMAVTGMGMNALGRQLSGDERGALADITNQAIFMGRGVEPGEIPSAHANQGVGGEAGDLDVRGQVEPALGNIDTPRPGEVAGTVDGKIGGFRLPALDAMHEKYEEFAGRARDTHQGNIGEITGKIRDLAGETIGKIMDDPNAIMKAAEHAKGGGVAGGTLQTLQGFVAPVMDSVKSAATWGNQGQGIGMIGAAGDENWQKVMGGLYQQNLNAGMTPAQAEYHAFQTMTQTGVSGHFQGGADMAELGEKLRQNVVQEGGAHGENIANLLDRSVAHDIAPSHQIFDPLRTFNKPDRMFGDSRAHTSPESEPLPRTTAYYLGQNRQTERTNYDFTDRSGGGPR